MDGVGRPRRAELQQRGERVLLPRELALPRRHRRVGLGRPLRRRQQRDVRAHPVEGVAVDAGGGGGQRAQRLLAALLAPLVAVPHLGDDARRRRRVELLQTSLDLRDQRLVLGAARREPRELVDARLEVEDVLRRGAGAEGEDVVRAEQKVVLRLRGRCVAAKLLAHTCGPKPWSQSHVQPAGARAISRSHCVSSKPPRARPWVRANHSGRAASSTSSSRSALPSRPPCRRWVASSRSARSSTCRRRRRS